MAFGASVRALLDTYANCVSLLKAFGRSGREDPDGGAVVDLRQRDHSRLRKSLKSDRALVKRAYSSKVSESGSRFKQGDARAIKALDRILKRLRNAITGLLRTSNKKDDLDLDYGSLMSLSNASRHDAIKAIDGLSRRLRSPTPASVVSSSTLKTSTTTTTTNKAQSRRKRKQSPSPDAAGASRSKPKQEARRDKSPSKKSSVTASAKDGKAAGSKERTSKAEPERLQKRAPAPPPPPKPASTPHKTRPSRAATGGRTHSPTTPKSPTQKPAAEPANRISMLSFSSDSTKLGEIPQRKWPQQRSEMVRYSSTSDDPNDDGGGDSTAYGVRPMFPLRPYTVEVKERRFLGWFSRKREA